MHNGNSYKIFAVKQGFKQDFDLEDRNQCIWWSLTHSKGLSKFLNSDTTGLNYIIYIYVKNAE